MARSMPLATREDYTELGNNISYSVVIYIIKGVQGQLHHRRFYGFFGDSPFVCGIPTRGCRNGCGSWL